MVDRLRAVLEAVASVDWDATPTPDRVAHVVQNFNISADEYLALALKQSGGCAICGGKSPKHKAEKKRGPEERRYLAVDHDHGTGKVRGLLCNGCNAGIGMFRDSPGLLRLAALYLEQHTDSEGQLW